MFWKRQSILDKVKLSPDQMVKEKIIRLMSVIGWHEGTVVESYSNSFKLASWRYENIMVDLCDTGRDQVYYSCNVFVDRFPVELSRQTGHELADAIAPYYEAWYSNKMYRAEQARQDRIKIAAKAIGRHLT